MPKSKVKTPESQLEERVREVLADGNREMAQIYQIELNTLRAKLDRIK